MALWRILGIACALVVPRQDIANLKKYSVRGEEATVVVLAGQFLGTLVILVALVEECGDEQRVVRIGILTHCLSNRRHAISGRNLPPTGAEERTPAPIFFFARRRV